MSSSAHCRRYTMGSGGVRAVGKPPGRATRHYETQCRPYTPRQCREKVIEHGRGCFERGGELKQQHPEFGSPGQGDAAKCRRRVTGFSQPCLVGNPTAGFEREPKMLLAPLGPTTKQARRRHPIERIVDFDRRQPLGIKRKHPLGRKPIRIELPLPLGIVVARGAGEPERGPGPSIRAK